MLWCVTESTTTEREVPARMRRALELVYAVEGVIGARVWQWPGGVAVGVTVATAFPQADTLRRVEVAIAPIRSPDEVWDFGVLAGA
jgi:hypothetical protein